MRPKVLALILAGGAGSRLDVLTQERAKPVMPFGGSYRLIDFALSNCMHSRLSDVWVIEQYQLHSLNEHLSNGRPWDLDRTYGGLQILPPYQANENDSNASGGFADGNADAIYRHRRLIQDFNPELLLVMSADHVYKLDYTQVIEAHLARQAEVTVVTTEVGRARASRFGVVEIGRDNRVTGFDYKPEKPKTGIVTTEVFVYSTAELFEILDDISTAKKRASADAKKADGKDDKNKQEDKNKRDNDKDKSRLRDFGHELLPELVKRGKAFDFRLKGYWRDVGTLRSYWHAHIQLLEEKPGLDLDEPSWRVHSAGEQRLPARIHATARIENSLIAPGCTVRGRVVRSVLSPGVVVEEGATVEDSILFTDVTVKSKARLTATIVDAEARIGENARIGKRVEVEKATDEDLTLIGRGANITAGAVVKAGERIEPHKRVDRKKS